MKAVRSFRTYGTTRLTTQHLIAEDLHSKQRFLPDDVIAPTIPSTYFSSPKRRKESIGYALL
jgi:hypothetical protein